MTTNQSQTSAQEFVSEEEEFSVNDRPVPTASSLVTSGWDAAEVLTPKREGGFPNDYKHKETPQIIKFIDQGGPFAAFKQHFLTKQGKRSYVCLNTLNDNTDCPLCTILHNKAEEKRCFTVINFSAEGGPEKQVLMASPRLYKSLSTAHYSPQGPLTKSYWALSRTGEKQGTVYHMLAIKPRDLFEDWNINEADAEALVSEAESFSPSIYTTQSYAELLQIAQEMMDN